MPFPSELPALLAGQSERKGRALARLGLGPHFAAVTVNDALNDAEVREKLLKTGATPVGGTPEQLGTFMKAEYEKWGRLAKEHDIKETP